MRPSNLGYVSPRWFRLAMGLAALGAAVLLARGPARAAEPPPTRSATMQPASSITLEALCGRPRLDGERIKGASFSGDGRLLAFIRVPAGSDAGSLQAVDLATGQERALVTAAALGGGAVRSAAETALLERLRVSDRGGITSFRWLGDGSGILVPHGGDLHLWRRGAQHPLEGRLQRLTATPAAEAHPVASRDGARVLFVREHDVHVLEVASGRELQLTAGGTEDVPNGEAEFVAQEEMGRTSGAFLSGDGRRVAFLQADQREVPQHHVIDVLADGVKVTAQRYPAAGETNASVRLGLIELPPGDLPLEAPAVRWLDLPGPAGSDPSSAYVARVEFAPDGRLLVLVQSRDQSRLDAHLIDPASGGSTLVFTESDPHWVDLPDSLAFTGRALGGSRPVVTGLLVDSQRGGRRHLWHHALDGSAAVQVTSGAWEVGSLAAVDMERGLVYFTATRDGAHERHLYRGPLAGGDAARLSGEAGWHAAVVSTEAGAWLDEHSRVSRPPSWRLVALAAPGAGAAPGQGAAQLPLVVEANPCPLLAGIRWAAPRFLELPGGDGTPLFARLQLPPSFAPGRLPVFVHGYGGPGSQVVKDAWGGERGLFEQFLLEQGWAILRVDGRGTGGRGAAFVQQVDEDLGRREAEDMAAAAAWLRTTEFADPERLVLFGWSYGGYQTLMTLFLHPGAYRAGIAGAPVTSWRHYDTHYTERFMGLPEVNAAGYEASAPLTHVAGLADALLVIHGLGDDNVHFQDSARLVAALVKAGRPHETLFLPGQRHGVRGETARLHVYRSLLRFLEREAGPRPAAPASAP